MEVMERLSGAVVPAVLAASAVLALGRGVDLFSALTKGAESGLRVVLRIFPSLAALLPAVYMLRASGLLEALTSLFSPVLAVLGIPEEMAPLMLIRPVSGSGALAAAGEIMERFGPDGLIGVTAAVMLGSTETTFYTVSTYFGALGIRDTRYAIPAALCADLAGFIAASFFARMFFG